MKRMFYNQFRVIFWKEDRLFQKLEVCMFGRHVAVWISIQKKTNSLYESAYFPEANVEHLNSKRQKTSGNDYKSHLIRVCSSSLASV